MSDIYIIIFLAWVVIYADLKLTRHNFGSLFNGIGIMPHVLRGNAKKPMQYRVLIPLLCKFFVGYKKDWHDYMTPYLWIRWVSIVLAIYFPYCYFLSIGVDGLTGAFLLCTFYVFAALYDYTDIYIEMFLFSLAFLIIGAEPVWGIPALVAITFIATLNKETAVFIPITLVLSGDIVVGVITFFIFAWCLILPIEHYGRVERYCSFFMVPENLRKIKDTFIRRVPILINEYIKFFALFLLVGYLYITNGSLSPVEVSMGLLFILMLIPSIWAEIRVFAPTMLAVIPMAIRGL